MIISEAIRKIKLSNHVSFSCIDILILTVCRLVHWEVLIRKDMHLCIMRLQRQLLAVSILAC